VPSEFRLGEGLVGQVAVDKERMVLTGVPADYVRINSGMGEGKPLDVVILPVLFEGQVKAVVELASFQHFSRIHLDFLDQLTDSIGIVINTIEQNMRSDELLKQSQILFAEAQEASRSKNALINMASQEMRTPLSAVVSYLSMLQDGTLNPDQWSGPIQILTLKAIELNKIVNDLMMAASMESASLPSEASVFDLRDAAREAIARAEPRAMLLQAQMQSRFPRHAVQVEADAGHVGRALDNLINNALTYCAGRPRVTITVTDGANPQVSVEDRGLGIRREMHERVFERFFRIDDPSIGPQPGTGLGLYIGRELAAHQGGSLTLERSEPGKGSKFVLRVPAAIPSEPQPAAAAKRSVAAPSTAASES
jgi:signal transduction histidine kinase